MSSRRAASARLAEESAMLCKSSGPSTDAHSARRKSSETSSPAYASGPVAPAQADTASSSQQQLSSSSSPVSTAWVRALRTRAQAIDFPRQPTTSSSSGVGPSARGTDAPPSKPSRRQRSGPPSTSLPTTAVLTPSHRRTDARPVLRDSPAGDASSTAGQAKHAADRPSCSVLRAPAASLLQQEKNEGRSDASMHDTADIANGVNPRVGPRPRAVRRPGEEASGRQRRHSPQPSAEDGDRASSHGSSSSASSPLLRPSEGPAGAAPPRHAAGPAPLLSTVPVHRSTAPTFMTGNTFGRRASALSSTYTPARDTPAATASLPSSSTRSGSRPCDAPALEKPWLAKVEGRGILKRRGSDCVRTGSIIVVPSSPTAKGLCLSATAPPPPRPPPSPSGPGAVHAAHHFRSCRPSRHVHFDEANIQYLDASASHVVHRDSQLGIQLNNVEWGAAMMSPATAPEYSGARRVGTGTTVSMGKAKTSAWGADSEWFNAEFGAQMETHTDHSDLSSPTLTPAIREASGSSTSLLSTSSAIHSKTQSAVVHTPSANTAVPTSTSRRSSSRSQTSERATRHADSEMQPRPSTPPVQRSTTIISQANRGEVREVDEGKKKEEARISSPVLTYERDPLNATTTTPSQSLLWTADPLRHPSPRPASQTFSANDAFVPAPPLSVGALRHRSSLSSTAPPSSSASPSPPGTRGGSRTRSSGDSRPRLSSPGVSLTNFDLCVLDIADEDFGRGTGTAKVDGLGTAAPPRVPAETLSALTKESNTDLSESPSTSVLQLSDSERRLLRAVMHVNQPSRPTHMSATTADGKTDSGGRSLCAAPVRNLGGPRAEMLSSGIRQFIEGDATHRGSRDRRRTSSPSPVAPSTTHGAEGTAVGGRFSESAGRVRVISTPLNHFITGEGAGAAPGPSPTSTTASTPLSLTSAESPLRVVMHQGSSGSRSRELNASSATIPRSVQPSQASGLDAGPVPATLATRRARSSLATVIDGEERVYASPPCTRAATTVAALASSSARQSGQTPPPPPPRPPPRRPPMPRKKAVKHRKIDDEDAVSDDAEPHLRVPVPTPRTTAASAWSSKRRPSL